MATQKDRVILLGVGSQSTSIDGGISLMLRRVILKELLQIESTQRTLTFLLKPDFNASVVKNVAAWKFSDKFL